MQKQQCNLAVLKILSEESDEEHLIKSDQILDELETNYDVSIERHKVVSVISTLRDFMYPIKSIKKNGGYMLLSHLFTKSELILLCTSIQSATFVDQKASDNLTERILGTGSKYHKHSYRSHVFHNNEKKVNNDQFSKSISTIYDAIDQGRKISFDYMHYKEDMQLHIVNKEPIIVEPREITTRNGQLYLLVTGGRHPGFMSYRIDKIANVAILEEKVTYMYQDKDAIELANERLYMYNGDNLNVTFRFKKNKLDQFVDAFGLNIHPHTYNDDQYECYVKTTKAAAVLFAQEYSDCVELISPEELRESMRTLLNTAADMYSK
jgi:predicted DNA-binding transcriptional regulator YafY